MMWPQKIIIVDDTDNGQFVYKVLQDLSWVKDFNHWLKDNSLGLYTDFTEIKELISSLPNDVKNLAKDKADFFKSMIVNIKINDKKHIESAITSLGEPGQNIAFVDFDYGKSMVANEIYKKHHSLLQGSPWKKVESNKLKGGCYFSSVFSPSVQNMRVLCPTTYVDPKRIISKLHQDIQNAITEGVDLHQGLQGGIYAAIAALEKWIEIQNMCPLPAVWKKTENWFSQNSRSNEDVPNRNYIPHSLPNELSHEFIKAYTKTVENVFGLHFPQEWQSKESIETIHELLKHLCGTGYCGTSSSDYAKNLTIGSVYLIALLAMRDSGNYYDLYKLRGKPVDPGKLKDGMKSKFLALQFKRDAEQSAKAIYHLLRNLFAQDPKHRDEDNNDKLPRLKEFGFVPNGKKMYFQFDWSKKANHGLATKVLRLRDQVISPDYATVTGSLSSLWSMLISSRGGFGGPGAIWMSGSVLYIASANSANNVLIICDDDRYEKWAKVLLEADVDSIYVLQNGSERRKVDKTNINIGGQIIDEDETLPKDICCALIHSGNQDLWDKDKLNVQVAFWFDSPGGPSAPDTDLSVRRQTSPFFDITIDDAQQILHYSIGYKQEIPDCCTEKRENHILSALIILCQGYLSVHAEHKEQDIAIALEQMDWNSVDKSLIPPRFGEKKSIEKVRNPDWWWAAFEDDFKNKDKKSLPIAIQKEWDTSSDKEISKELEDLIKLIVADNEVKPPGMVAKAYLALVEKLGV